MPELSTFPATDVERRIDAIIRNLAGPLKLEGLRRSSEFFTDLDADSLDMIELWMAIEEEFDIAVSDDDAERIKTVADAVEIVQARLKAKAAQALQPERA